MSTLQAVAVFLAAALILFVVTTVVFAFRCNYLHAERDEQDSVIERYKGDIKQLVEDKTQIIEECQMYHNDNVRLTAAVQELREINTELAAINKQITDHTAVEVVTSKRYLPPETVPTNMFRCEPYNKFVKNSDQARLMDDYYTVTDFDTGIRVYYDDLGDKWYCAALAGAYGIEIGMCYKFTLANGQTIPVMLADFKHPIDKPRDDDYGDNDTNYDGEGCINVIEFIVDMERIPDAVKKAGTMSALPMFGGIHGHDGNIVDVCAVGRRWKP